jgi:hypothetical protein
VGTITDRTAEETDYQTWRVLWAGCNAFYGRSGDTSVPDAIIETTWRRFFDPEESMRALVAELDGGVERSGHRALRANRRALRLRCFRPLEVIA